METPRFFEDIGADHSSWWINALLLSGALF
jgi:hypothetical protein